MLNLLSLTFLGIALPSLIFIGIGVLALADADDFKIAKICFVGVGIVIAAKIIQLAIRHGDWATYPLFGLAVVACILFCMEASSYVDRKRTKKLSAEKDQQESAEATRGVSEPPTATLPNTSNAAVSSAPKTLHQLFRTDFSKCLTIHQNCQSTVSHKLTGEVKGTINYEFELLADLDANSEFLAIYVPDTQNAEFLCEAFLEIYKGLVKEMKQGIVVEGGFPFERPTSLKDLRFTGRVYIYHETFFTTEQKERLIALYKTKKLAATFRGHVYQIESSIARTAPPGAKPL